MKKSEHEWLAYFHGQSPKTSVSILKERAIEAAKGRKMPPKPAPPGLTELPIQPTKPTLPAVDNFPETMGRADAAEFIGVRQSDISALVKKGKLPKIQQGWWRVFRKDDLKRLAETESGRFDFER